MSAPLVYKKGKLLILAAAIIRRRVGWLRFRVRLWSPLLLRFRPAEQFRRKFELSEKKLDEVLTTGPVEAAGLVHSRDRELCPAVRRGHPPISEAQGLEGCGMYRRWGRLPW